MQINQLPDANRYLVPTDYLAIDDEDGVTKKVSADRLAISPYTATITAGQWSGSGSDYYISVNASNTKNISLSLTDLVRNLSIPEAIHTIFSKVIEHSTVFF